jgi:putative methionine-R-sulfoxide reductase with GAF domain
MAGLAAERRECVQICNLQSDKSGQVKPMAKLTGMEGSIAVPMLVDGEVCGVLGVAKPTEYEFTPAEKQLLLDIGGLIGRRLK